MKKNGKYIALLLLAVCVALCFGTACKDKKYAVELDKETAALYVGEEIELTAVVTLDGKETQVSVDWSSSDTSVATVTDGKVSALKAGTATITATAGKASATCVVTVTTPTFTISLDKSEAALFVGENLTLNATASDGIQYNYVWTSSDEAVARVENGVVTALSEGTATITAKCYNLTATCVITVSEEDVFLVISNNSAEIKVGHTLTLTAAMTDGSTPTFTWTSSDETVASVSDGVVTALKSGTTVITVSAGDGLTDTCNITVTDDYTLIFPEMPKYLFVGEEIDLGIVVRKNGEAGDANDVEITGDGFSVDSGKITVTESGEITVSVSYFGESRSQTVSAYYAVTNAADLSAINSNLSAWYMLTTDIDFEGGYVETIAHYSDGHSSSTSGFLGVFDGNGHSIMNFTAVYKGNIAANSSLFGWIGGTGIVRNLNVFNASIKNRITGGIANTNHGLIDNCFVEVTVNYMDTNANAMNNPIGGVCSKNYGNISNTIAVLSLGPEVTDTSCIGGFVGRHLSGSSMTNCHVFSPLGFNEVAEPTNGAMAGVLTSCGSYDTLEGLYANINQAAFSELWTFNPAVYPYLGSFTEEITVLNTNYEVYAGTSYTVRTQSTLPLKFSLTESVDGVTFDGPVLSVGESVAADTEIKVRIYSMFDAAAIEEITLTVLENNVEVTAEKTEAEFNLIEGEGGVWSQDLGIVVKINGIVVQEGFEIISSDTSVATVEGSVVTCVGDGVADIEVTVDGTVMLTVRVVCNVYKTVRTTQDFEAIRNAQHRKYILMNDIDFGGATFSAFSCWATAVSTSKSSQFTGVFDGNGYSLININPGQEIGSGSNDWSIFGVVGKTGVIRNLSVIGSKINNRAGVISSYLCGTVENCYVEVTICSTANTNTNNPVGGIAEKALAGSLVKDCIVVATMADGVSATNVGGIIGQSVGRMENSQLININGSLGVHDGNPASVGEVVDSAAYAGVNAFYDAATGADLSRYGEIWVFNAGYLPHLDKMTENISINIGENVYQGTDTAVEVISVFGATLSLKEAVNGVTLVAGVLKVASDAVPETQITLVAASIYLPAVTVEKTVTVKVNEFSVDIGVTEYEFTWISGTDTYGNPYAVQDDYSATPEFTVYLGSAVYNGETTLTSSDTNIVTIENGKIVAVGDGSAEISVSVGDAVLGTITVVSNMYIPVRTTQEFLAIGTNAQTMSKKYLLMNDLDFEGAPIYAFSSYKTSATIKFTGIFDGNGYTIADFEPRANQINAGDADRAIFGYMDQGAIVRNVAFIDVKAADRFALVSNWCQDGLIENVYAEVVYDNTGLSGLNATASNPTGIMIAKSRGKSVIRNCIVNLTVAEGSYNAFIGGIVGDNVGQITNCALIYAARTGETVNPAYKGTGTITAITCENVEAFFTEDISGFDVNVWSFDVPGNTISLKQGCFGS